MSDYKNHFNLRALNFQRQYPQLKWQHCCILAHFYTKAEMQIEQKRSHEQLQAEEGAVWARISHITLSTMGMQQIENYMLEAIDIATNQDVHYDGGYNSNKLLSSANLNRGGSRVDNLNRDLFYGI